MERVEIFSEVEFLEAVAELRLEGFRVVERFADEDSVEVILESGSERFAMVCEEVLV